MPYRNTSPEVMITYMGNNQTIPYLSSTRKSVMLIMALCLYAAYYKWQLSFDKDPREASRGD